MSRWTSRRAILRDLSLAQGGCGAGAAVEGGDGGEALAACDRPPPAPRREDTEEEYLKQYVSSAEAEAAGEGEPFKPDLGLIRQMLDMVRDLNVSEEEVKADDVAVISKRLNPCSSEFVPRSTACKPNMNTLSKTLLAEETCTPRNTPPPKKQKKQRNAALESILRALEDQEKNCPVECNRSLTLLPPRNLITNIQDVKEITSLDARHAESKENSNLLANNTTDTKVENGHDKVKDWMARMRSPIRGKSPRMDTLSLDTSSMFKKKSKTSAGVRSEGERRREVRESSRGGAVPGYGAYVPSPRADLYYQQYLQRSQLMDSMSDDIWTKAEKTMRKIDENKRLEVSQRVSSEVEAEVISEAEPEADPCVSPRRDTRPATAHTASSARRCCGTPPPPPPVPRCCGTPPPPPPVPRCCGTPPPPPPPPPVLLRDLTAGDGGACTPDSFETATDNES